MERPPLLCDTGVLSRVITGREAAFTNAYSVAADRFTPVISVAIYIELMKWVSLERSKEKLTRSEFDRFQHRINQLLLVDGEGIGLKARDIARARPSLGVGDCYTIATALVNGIPIFTLNPKDFRRVAGLDLYEPEGYPSLVRLVKRNA